MPPNNSKVLHRALRRVALWAVSSFFTEIHVIGGENVPKDGPLIVASTHHNMMIDPAILSVGFPYKRILHYWSKASIFINPVASWILYSSGNIPVDRKTKDRRKLFKGTFVALSQEFAVAIFPEGTSYTEPKIMQIKDGAAYAALEYTKWDREQGKGGKQVIIQPTAIVYTDKTKYRSDVIMEFGRPISVDEYIDEYMSGDEDKMRSAAKRLTKRVLSEWLEITINAPDWDTLFAARMARDLLWEKSRSINLDEFVAITQTLVDLISTSDAVPNFISLKKSLLHYYSLLQLTSLSNSTLSALPLPQTLDPNKPYPLPSRLRTLLFLVFSTMSALLRLPFFIFPFLLHLPIYITSKYGGSLAEGEEETMAQNKVVFGLLLSLMVYPATFFVLWRMLWWTKPGAVLAFAIVWLGSSTHTKMINTNYNRMKQLVAAWRVLIGVWAPNRLDLSLVALEQYMTPVTPKPNEFLDYRKHEPLASTTPAASSPEAPSPAPVGAVKRMPSPGEERRRRKRPPTRRVMRHVLRARAEASKALASIFSQLERLPSSSKLNAALHLAKRYGGELHEVDSASGEKELKGYRSPKEVISFLRKRGANISELGGRIEGEWAALSSDGEHTPMEERSEPEWVPSSSS